MIMQHIHFRQTTQPTSRRTADRRGSVMLVVIGLMGLLALLGFIFYSFAAQEQLNATYYTEGAKADVTDVDYFDFALAQLIVGPADDLGNSALSGGRHALLPNMLGVDAHPYNGPGVNLISTAAGVPLVDQNYNGIDDLSEGYDPTGRGIDLNGNAIHDLLEFNYSPVAWGGRPYGNYNVLPAADVDYTSPDINNMFLAYRAALPEIPGLTVLTPSFHRPQYLRTPAGVIPTWSTIPSTAGRVMRPHPEHIHKLIPGGGAGVFRFLDSNRAADNAIIAALPGGSGGFPFRVDTNANGVFNEQGLWTPAAFPSTNQQHEYDSDNDQDGIPEGIWLDLDFSMLETPAGIKYVPLFSFTVYDADALFNLNAHGNIHRNIPAASFSSPFGLGDYIHQSNHGLGPHEVNPAWGLNADPRGNDHNAATPGDNIAPAAVFNQHSFMFGGTPPATMVELGNMELQWINSGRGQLSGAAFAASAAPSDMYPGRFGEANVLYSWLTGAAGSTYPKAGHTWYPAQSQSYDDNRNETAGEGAPYDFTNLPFGQPLDYHGFGRYWDATGFPNPKVPNLSAVVAGNPSRWLEYVGYSPTGYATSVPWPVVSGSSIPFPLRDEPLELMLEPTRLHRPYDEAFGPEEMALLHLSNTQAIQYAAGSRLLNLAPINFSTGLTQGSQIPSSLRQRFTTLSWDRKNFSPRLRPWEFNADTDDTNGDGIPEGDGKFEFPPVFLGEPAAWRLDDPRRPFRLELRRLLTVEAGNVNQAHPQMRLSVNGVLDVERKPNQRVDRQKGPLQFRPLTPHPPSLTSAAVNPAWNNVSVNLNFPPYPPTAVPEQEWWARYDRQVMARDIYVLLYTLGGSDTLIYTGTNDHSNTMTPTNVTDALYSRAQLREMAQFAVNLVDALDRDNIVTRFEYDKNLGQTLLYDPMTMTTSVVQTGWNLDDNPFTTDYLPLLPGDPNFDSVAREDSIERGVVYGIEAQSLTFSEAVAIYAKLVDNAGTPVDHFATEWNDTVNTLFAHVELRNASPYPVTFGTNAAAGQQQWAVGFRPVGGTATDERRVIIQNPPAASNAVAAGGLYTIGSADLSTVSNTSGAGNYSQFRVDTGWTVGDAQPTSYPTPISPVSGSLNLDLITSYVAGPGPGSPFRITDGVSPTPAYYDVAGGWLQGVTITDANYTDDQVFVLYRRAHPTRPAPTVGNAAEENDNPWVAVDRIVISQWRKFELTPTTDSTSVPYTTSGELAGTAGAPSAPDGIASMERSEPLNGGTEIKNAPPDTTPNSLGGNNANTPAAGFSTWQGHFDRDFASAGELLSLPLSSPPNFTRDFGLGLLPPLTQYTAVTPPRVAIASAKFLLPDYPDTLDASPALDNRWYRLFEFVEVPSRTHVGLSPEFNNPLNFIRKPGSINLNTLRHPEVLAGLIDDRDVARNYEYDVNGNAVFDPAEDLDGNGVMTLPLLPGLPDASAVPAETARNWWNQFIIARDGTDANGVATAPNGGTAADPTTGRFLPGVAGSHPFRSLSHVGSTGSISGGLESTILRSLPLDAGLAAGQRHLFELASAGEALSPSIRHRMLSKMLNNVTTRSNVFIVYVTVGFFEADQSLPTGEVRVGGEVAGMARRRGFFVIDRSLAEEAFDSGTGTFSNWRALVKYQLKP
jgi:hypothetical protein